MFADPFNSPVDVSGGTETTVPFTLISLGMSNSVRKNVTADAGDPRVLEVSHSVVGKNSTTRDRHLVKMKSYQLDDEGEEDQSSPALVFYAVADVPRSGFTADQITAMFQQFVGLLRGAGGDAANSGDQTVFLNKWLNGEC